MDLTEQEWRLILEMYELGMVESYKDGSPEEIDATQRLFHRVLNMVNKHYG